MLTQKRRDRKHLKNLHVSQKKLYENKIHLYSKHLKNKLSRRTGPMRYAFNKTTTQEKQKIK